MRWMMFTKILIITIQKEIKKVLIVLDDLFADIMTNKKFQAISLVFISQSSFSVPKDARLNTTHYFIMNINNRIELKNIVTDHSADIDYQDFKKIYRECTKEPYNF